MVGRPCTGNAQHPLRLEGGWYPPRRAGFAAMCHLAQGKSPRGAPPSCRRLLRAVLWRAQGRRHRRGRHPRRPKLHLRAAGRAPLHVGEVIYPFPSILTRIPSTVVSAGAGGLIHGSSARRAATPFAALAERAVIIFAWLSFIWRYVRSVGIMLHT